jgi:hypothetical protein
LHPILFNWIWIQFNWILIKLLNLIQFNWDAIQFNSTQCNWIQSNLGIWIQFNWAKFQLKVHAIAFDIFIWMEYNFHIINSFCERN